MPAADLLPAFPVPNDGEIYPSRNPAPTSQEQALFERSIDQHCHKPPAIPCAQQVLTNFRLPP